MFGTAGGVSVVVLSAFGGDAVCSVLGAGAASFGHHRGPLSAVVDWQVGFGCRHATGGQAQTGEQQRAAGGVS